MLSQFKNQAHQRTLNSKAGRTIKDLTLFVSVRLALFVEGSMREMREYPVLLHGCLTTSEQLLMAVLGSS